MNQEKVFFILHAIIKPWMTVYKDKHVVYDTVSHLIMKFSLYFAHFCV